MFNTPREALIALAPILSSPAVHAAGATDDLPVAALTDAHTHTRTLIRSGYQTLLAIDNQYVHADRPAMTIEPLLNEIVAYAVGIDYAEVKLANLIRVTEIINSFAQGVTHGVEAAETNISVVELLLRVWNLARRLSAHHTSQVTLPDQILECLENNISDHGSCIPGVIARLYPAYAIMLEYEISALCRAPVLRQRA
jgi:hypothetical protein